MRKQAYGLKDLLGDSLASAGAGARAYVGSVGRENDSIVQQHADSQLRLGNAQNEMDRTRREYLNEYGRDPYRNQQLDAAHLDAYKHLEAAQNSYNISGKYAPEAQRVSDKVDKYYPALGAGAFLAGGVPVGDHVVGTPVATLAGSVGGEALSRLLSPYGSHAQHGLASAGGALLGRMALRGYDALQERSDPTRGFKKESAASDEQESPSFGRRLLRTGATTLAGTVGSALARQLAGNHYGADGLLPMYGGRDFFSPSRLDVAGALGGGTLAGLANYATSGPTGDGIDALAAGLGGAAGSLAYGYTSLPLVARGSGHFARWANKEPSIKGRFTSMNRPLEALALHGVDGAGAGVGAGLADMVTQAVRRKKTKAPSDSDASSESKKTAAYTAGARDALIKLSVDFMSLNPLSWSAHTAPHAAAVGNAISSGARRVRDAASSAADYLRNNGESIGKGLVGAALLGGGAYAAHRILNTQDELDRVIPRDEIYDPTELQNGVF